MQTLPTIQTPLSDCYLQIRRAKQTIFTDISETATVLELKQILGHILDVEHDIIRLIAKGQVLDIDSKHLNEYGITTKEARPQNPFQLEIVFKLEDGTYENVQIVPYSTQNDSVHDDQQ